MYNPNWYRDHRAKHWAKDPIRTWVKIAYQSAKLRAKRKGVPFAITQADITAVVTDTCPVLGLQLAYARTGNGAMQRSAPTLDRIKNHLGYVPGNIIVVSWRANKLKGDATPDELRAVADFYS